MSSALRIAAVAALSLGLQACYVAMGGGHHQNTVNFGDDRSQWAYDHECDDARIEGPGITNTPLLHQDMYHDATDCHHAWLAGNIWLR